MSRRVSLGDLTALCAIGLFMVVNAHWRSAHPGALLLASPVRFAMLLIPAACLWFIGAKLWKRELGAAFCAILACSCWGVLLIAPQQLKPRAADLSLLTSVVILLRVPLIQGPLADEIIAALFAVASIFYIAGILWKPPTFYGLAWIIYVISILYLFLSYLRTRLSQ